MRGIRWRRSLSSGAPIYVLVLTLAAGANQHARAQETAVELAPREEMIDAIIHHARKGNCSGFGALFVSLCVGFIGEGALHSAQDAVLMEVCRKNGIADCQKRQEISTGRPVLRFHGSVAVKGAHTTAAWSPDNRFLVVFSRPPRPPRDLRPTNGSTLIVDIEQWTTRTLSTDVADIVAVAWSPDGKWIAVNKQRAIHLFAFDSLEEKGAAKSRVSSAPLREF